MTKSHYSAFFVPLGKLIIGSISFSVEIAVGNEKVFFNSVLSIECILFIYAVGVGKLANINIPNVKATLTVLM